MRIGLRGQHNYNIYIWDRDGSRIEVYREGHEFVWFGVLVVRQLLGSIYMELSFGLGRCMVDIPGWGKAKYFGSRHQSGRGHQRPRQVYIV